MKTFITTLSIVLIATTSFCASPMVINTATENKDVVTKTEVHSVYISEYVLRANIDQVIFVGDVEIQRTRLSQVSTDGETEYFAAMTAFRSGETIQDGYDALQAVLVAKYNQDDNQDDNQDE
jgi:hypothetical protein